MMSKDATSPVGGDSSTIVIKEGHHSHQEGDGSEQQSEVKWTPDDEVEEPQGLALPPPPDGGYGWVIVLATFTSNFVIMGTNLSFGMFLEPLVEAFEAQHKTVAFIRSILNFTILFGMTPSSALINRCGAQLIFFCGCILSSISFFVMPFTRQITWVYISCCISGAGMSASFLASLILTNMYFEKRRSLACGIVLSGSAIGQSGMSFMISKLIVGYSWRNASLITGSIMLSISLLAPLMRNLKLVAIQDTQEEDDDDVKENTNAKDDTEEGSVQNRYHKDKNIPTTPQKCTRRVSIVAPVLSMQILDERGNLTMAASRTSVVNNHVYHMNRRRSSAAFAAISRFHANPTALGTEDARTFSRRPSITLMQTVQSDVNGASGTSSKANRRASVAMVVGDRQMSFSLNQGAILSNNASQYTMRPFARRDTLFEGSISKLAADMIRKRSSLTSESLNAVVGETKEKNMQKKILDEYRSSILAQGDNSTDPSFGIPVGIGRLETLEEGSKGMCPADSKGGVLLASHLNLNAGEIQDEEMRAEHKASNRPFMDVIRTMIDFRLLSLRSFQLAVLGRASAEIGFFIPFSFLPSMMYRLDLSADQIGYCISAMGIANLAGRLLSGLIIGLPFINSSHFSNLMTVLTGITICLLPVCPNYEAFMAGSVAFGLASGAPIVALTLVLTDMYGIESLTSAIGMLGVFRGVASFIGPVLTGFFFDHFGSYLYSFLVMGVTVLVGGIVTEISYMVRLKEAKMIKHN